MPGIKIKNKEYKPEKNYVKEYLKKKEPTDITKYRKKVIYDKNGYRHVLTIGIRSNGKTVATSIEHPKNEPKAKKIITTLHKKGVKTAAMKNNPFYILKTKLSETGPLIRSVDNFSKTYFNLYTLKFHEDRTSPKTDEHKTYKKRRSYNSSRKRKKRKKYANLNFKPNLSKKLSSIYKVTKITPAAKVSNHLKNPMLIQTKKVSRKAVTQKTKSFPEKLKEAYKEQELKAQKLLEKQKAMEQKRKDLMFHPQDLVLKKQSSLLHKLFKPKQVKKVVKTTPKLPEPKNLYSIRSYSYKKPVMHTPKYNPHVQQKAKNMDFWQKQELAYKLKQAKNDLEKQLANKNKSFKIYGS